MRIVEWSRRALSAIVLGILLAGTSSCQVKIGNHTFTTPPRREQENPNLVLTPDSPARTTGHWRLDLKEWKSRQAPSLSIELVEGNRTRGWFFRHAQQTEALRDLPSRDGPVAASLPADAGTLQLDGSLINGKASGAYRFVPNQSYSGEVSKLLGRDLKDEELLELALTDVGLDYINGLRESGVAKTYEDVITLRRHGVSIEDAKAFASLGFKAQEITRLRAHGIRPEFVRDTRAHGYGQSVDDLTKLRAHGVAPDLLKEWKSNGFSPDLDEVIRLRSHGLQPGYAAAWKKAGFDFTFDEIIRARSHGVPVEFAAALKGPNAPKLEEIIRLRQFGVTPEYYRAVKDFDPSYTSEDMVRFRQQGITPEYLIGVKKAGYTFDRDDLIKLKQYGVQPDYLAAINVPGRKPLDLAAILELRNRGVSAETARRLRE